MIQVKRISPVPPFDRPKSLLPWGWIMTQDDWWFAASIALTLLLMGVGFFVYVIIG
ncbi:MAG: hypothetical protein GY844_11120 [Bradyrhizobium sp.]|nr:hypothetical protein [Bradyrhizobium sp.]